MYNVLIDNDVLREDFKGLDRLSQQNIVKSIRKKLSTHPYLYGKPLTGELKQYWKLKVGPFKVIYEIVRREVTVHVIKEGFRKGTSACLDTARRLGFI